MIEMLCLLVASALTQEAPQVIPLWKNGAPGFERLRNEPEQAKDYWVKHINNPSLTVFVPPKGTANGSAIVIAPGGGHSQLVFGPEGLEPAVYLSKLGITCFALKYRLGREPGSPYKIEVHAKQDGLRAMRLVRSRAAEWGIDPKRIGFLGFSAGCEVVSMVAYGPTEGDPAASDPVDQVSARPDFIMQVYPGPIGVPDVLPSGAPPAFLLVSNDDQGHSDVIVRLIEEYRKAGIPMEAHIFQQGGHGFNMGNRSKLASIKSWPQRLADWLSDSGYLARK